MNTIHEWCRRQQPPALPAHADADTYPGTIAFSATDGLTTTFQVPRDATTRQTIHAVIQVTDNGAPALTRFHRVIVTIKTP